MEVTSSNERRPMTFIALTLVLSCPFWVLGTSLLVAVLFHTMINTSASLSPTPAHRPRRTSGRSSPPSRQSSWPVSAGRRRSTG